MEQPTWSLQDEILALLRRWYWLAAALLAGGLLGWVAAFLLPARYEAEAALSVSFNADAIYLTPDDYKNWQIAELNDFVLAGPILDQTGWLFNGAGQHEGWDGVDSEDLRAAFSPRWRNAGIWQLAVVWDDPDEAVALAQIWRNVVLDRTADAHAHALAFNELDRQLDALAQTEGLVVLDLSLLQAVVAELETPPGSADEAVAFAARLQHLQTTGLALPALPESPTDAELADWARASRGLAADEIAHLESVRAGIRSAYDVVQVKWLAEQNASGGLSAYLVVEAGDDPDIRLSRSYSSGSLSLAGALIAVMGMFGYRLFAVALRSQRESAD